MLSGEGITRERWKTTIGLISKKGTFARAAHFFVHFFAVVLHEFNGKLPETFFYGENFVRVLVHFFSQPHIFFLYWCPIAFRILSPPLQNFHVIFPTKNVSFVLALDLCRPFSRWASLAAAYFLFFSVFLLLYILNLWAINLSLILWKTRIQKQFPLSVFEIIDSLGASALQDAGGYAISYQNNIELHLGCHTCWLSYFTLVYLRCGWTDGWSGARSRD